MDRAEDVAASGLDAWEHRRMRHEGTGIHRIFIHRPRPTLTRRRGWLAWLDRGDEVVGPVGKVDLGGSQGGRRPMGVAVADTDGWDIAPKI